MRIEKRNYSRGQWRLVADDGREIDRVEAEHGYVLPICADTKEGLVRVILAHYEQCCAELNSARLLIKCLEETHNNGFNCAS